MKPFFVALLFVLPAFAGIVGRDVEHELREITEEAHGHGALLKVIFETDFLSDDAIKIRLCEICERVGQHALVCIGPLLGSGIDLLFNKLELILIKKNSRMMLSFFTMMRGAGAFGSAFQPSFSFLKTVAGGTRQH